jgi:hypothetical protein
MANMKDREARARSANPAAQAAGLSATGVSACLSTLINLLGDSVELLTDAQSALEIGQQNVAMGSILQIEQRLADAHALHRATLVLHRYR